MKTVEEHKVSKTHIKNLKSFSKQYRFEYEDWYEELSQIEIAFFVDCIEMLENRKEDLLSLLANRKKRLAMFNKYTQIITKKSRMLEKRPIVQAFFDKVPIDRFIFELNLIPLVFDYVVEDHVAIYNLGTTVDGETTPFEVDRIVDEKIGIEVDGEIIQFSLQALLYFTIASEMVHQQDEARIIACKCKVPEATYAVSYSTTLLLEDLTSYYINPSSNSITSFFIAIIMFTKTNRFMKDAQQLPEVLEVEGFEDKLSRQQLHTDSKNSHILNSCYFFYLEKHFSKIEAREKNALKKQHELQQKLEKLKEKFDNQLEKIRQLKSNVENSTVHASVRASDDQALHDQISHLQNQVKDLKSLAKETEKTNKATVKSLETKLTSSAEENTRLTTEISSLHQKLNIEKKSKVQIEELTFEQWLAKGPSYLQQLSSADEQQLQNFLDLATNVLEEQRKQRPKHALMTNKIGYCLVNSEGHFIQFADGEMHPILNLPDDVYLSNQQFIEVTKDFEFARKLPYFYNPGPYDSTITHFVMIEERHQQAFAKVEGKSVQILYRNNAFIQNNQVISINSNLELVSYYKNRPITLDDIIQSIRLKGHEPLYVELALTNGYVVRDLHDVQQFVTLSEPLPAYSFIITQNQETVIFKDLTGLFYKKSSLYKQKQLASVSEIEEDIYVLKQNQEYVLLQNPPHDIELDLGDMLWVDEHNRMIELVQEESAYMTAETIEQKLLEGGRKVTRKVEKNQIIKDKNLLIIGNIRISERYKKYFGEIGYEVAVVDGTGPFEKIRQACTKHENILYSTSFTSHKNSGKIANEISKSIILCDSTAPKVMRSVLEAI